METNAMKNPVGDKISSRLIMLEHGWDSSLADAFILVTCNGKVVLIDTGTTGSADLIEEEVMKLGGKVDACIITHQHDDHTDGLIKLINDGKIKILAIYWAPLNLEFIAKYEPASLEKAIALNDTIENSNMNVFKLKAGDVLKIDNCTFEVLAGGEEYEVNPINNASLIFTVNDGKRKFLFTGDAGEEEGQELMKTNFDFTCDILKVSHHGQAGLPLEFYGRTKAKIALFPTAKWLWEWETTQSTVKYLQSLDVKLYSIHSHGRVEL